LKIRSTSMDGHSAWLKRLTETKKKKKEGGGTMSKHCGVRGSTNFKGRGRPGRKKRNEESRSGKRGILTDAREAKGRSGPESGWGVTEEGSEFTNILKERRGRLLWYNKGPHQGGTWWGCGGTHEKKKS